MRKIIAFMSCIGLAACSGTASENEADMVSGETEPVRVGTEVATEPAAVAQANINCDRIKGQTAPQGQPPDDILGVRHGMPLENVKNILRCTNPLFLFEENESGNSNLTSRTVTLIADSGLDKIKAAFIGPKGRERLIGIARQTEYAAGKEPPIPVVVSAIEQKYGDFDAEENSPGRTPKYEGIRLFSPSGQRLAEDNSDYRKCMYNVWNWRSMSPSIPSLDNCGVGIIYDVRPKSENDDLVKMFTVAVVNQAAALRDVEMVNAAETQQAEATAAEAKEKGLGPTL